MKRCFNIILLLPFAISLCGHEVTETLAVRMANAYYQMIQAQTKDSVGTITKGEKRAPECVSPLGKAKMWFVPVDDGWVLLSGDTKATPILAHIPSYEKPKIDSLPPAVKEILYSFEDYIAYINEHNRDGSEDERWEYAKIENRSSNKRDMNVSTTYIGPLLDVQWGQTGGGTCATNKIYNKFCPAINHPKWCDKAAVGCGAVAIGQIMWYWQWPNAAIVPKIMLDTLGHTQDSILQIYDWNNIPSALYYNSSNEQVDNLTCFLRDCGYAVNMRYKSAVSSSDWSKLGTALNNIFSYSGIQQSYSQYQDTLLINDIKTEINNERPVLMYGNGSSGHFFIVYGYTSNDMFYINWGWRGSYNNVAFAINGLTPYSYNFSYGRSIMKQLKPNPNCSQFIDCNQKTYSSDVLLSYSDSIRLCNMTISDSAKCVIQSGTIVTLEENINVELGTELTIDINEFPCNN